MKSKSAKSKPGIAVTNVRIPAEVRAALSAAAARERRSLANYLIIAAMERLEKTASPVT